MCVFYTTEIDTINIIKSLFSIQLQGKPQKNYFVYGSAIKKKK